MGETEQIGLRRKIKRYPPMSGVRQKRTLPSGQQRISRFTSLEGTSDFANASFGS
jgi:hypothetical protein